MKVCFKWIIRHENNETHCNDADLNTKDELPKWEVASKTDCSAYNKKALQLCLYSILYKD